MSDTGNKPAGSLSERVRSLRLSESNESGSGPLWWLPWAVCMLLLLAVGFLSLEAFSPISDELLKKLAEERGLNIGKTDSGSPKLGLPGTGGTSLSASDLAHESKGYIVPISLIQVSPKISGTVMKLYIKEGMMIDKNEPIADIEDIEYKADLDRAMEAKNAAKARLDVLQQFRPEETKQAKADLDDAKAQLDQAESKFERAKKLKQDGVISPEDYEAAQTGFQSMKARRARAELSYDWMRRLGPRDAQIDAAKAEQKQAEADWVKSNWRFENTKVKAPIKGIILSKKTEEGNIVNPSVTNGLSASLCEMADLHKLEVELKIAERDIIRIFKDQECRIRAEAFPDRIYSGYVSRVMPMGDRGNSAVPVRVLIQFPPTDAKGKALPMDKQGEFLRPEMGAIVTFLTRKAPGK